jgi:hypothetical protein
MDSVSLWVVLGLVALRKKNKALGVLQGAEDSGLINGDRMSYKGDEKEKGDGMGWRIATNSALGAET